MTTIRIRLVTVLCLVAPSICFSWGDDGHRIVGHIAAAFLTPEAEAAVKELLGDQTLADVAPWADTVRSDPRYQWTEPLHFGNVEPGVSGFNPDKDCPEEGCVVSAIHRFGEVLLDKDADRTERIEALKFVVHFVADLHQPLAIAHVRDHRGRDVAVEFLGKKTDLLEVWDSGLIRSTHKPWREYGDALQSEITFAQRGAWAPRTPNRGAADRSIVGLRPYRWAGESYNLALAYAYVIPGDGRLHQRYIDRSVSVVEERLQIAGVRLAEMLNRLFSPPE